MARVEGFEPPITGPEPVALPLGYTLLFKMRQTYGFFSSGQARNEFERGLLFALSYGGDYSENPAA